MKERNKNRTYESQQPVAWQTTSLLLTGVAWILCAIVGLSQELFLILHKTEQVGSTLTL
jgi:hypothetical protein